MKRVVIFIIFLFCFLITDPILAEDSLEEAGKVAYPEKVAAGAVPPQLVIARVIKIFLGFLGVSMVGLMVYAGFMWIFSEGNTEKITKARGIIIGSAVGFALILTAYAITDMAISGIVSSGA